MPRVKVAVSVRDTVLPISSVPLVPLTERSRDFAEPTLARMVGKRMSSRTCTRLLDFQALAGAAGAPPTETLTTPSAIAVL